jgi:hypothetical protein
MRTIEQVAENYPSHLLGIIAEPILWDWRSPTTIGELHIEQLPRPDIDEHATELRELGRNRAHSWETLHVQRRQCGLEIAI